MDEGPEGPVMPGATNLKGGLLPSVHDGHHGHLDRVQPLAKDRVLLEYVWMDTGWKRST